MASRGNLLADAYRSALASPIGPIDDLASLLEQKLGEAETAHPGLLLAPEDFARHLAQKTNAESSLDALMAPDLYLARATANGSSPALARFRELHASCIRNVHARSSGTRPPLDELMQVLEEKL